VHFTPGRANPEIGSSCFFVKITIHFHAQLNLFEIGFAKLKKRRYDGARLSDRRDLGGNIALD
jgi:hypothetical protein